MTPAVRRIILTNFRNYRALRLQVDAAPAVLTGPNGAGKTNLLEALSFLAPGRGLRRAKLGEVARRPADSPAGSENRWAVAATVDTDDGAIDLGTGRDSSDGADDGSDRRAVRIDGAPAKSQSALAEVLSVAWLTPEMDRLFMEGASARRRFLDRLIYGFVPEHASRLSAYERAMRERNRLLKDGGGDASWFTALEQQMAETGVSVAAARRDFVRQLNQASAEAQSAFPQPAVAMSGAMDDWLADGPALAAEDRFRDELAATRPVDAAAGRATQGPHRSDLAVRHAVRDVPAAECSTGEQKALLISLVLATARLRAVERGAPPLLLLDEVVAHLDADRRSALFDELMALGAQAWLTGTDRALFTGLAGRAQFFDVAGGTVAPADGTT